MNNSGMSISDKILLLKDGKYQQYSEPQHMYDRPVNAFVGTFMGNPPINMLPVTFNKEHHSIQIKDTYETLNLPSDLNPDLASGAHMILGVRAEDFIFGEASETGPFISVKTEMVERIGRDTLLNATVGEHTIRALIGQEAHIRPGDIIKLAIRKNRMHLFDAKSEGNLAVTHS